MPKRGSPYPQLKGPRQSVGVHIPGLRGHAKSEGVRIPNSRGHTKAWDSVSPTRGGGVLLRMQDLHFATNDICIAARLANLPLESTSQQMTFV